MLALFLLLLSSLLVAPAVSARSSPASNTSPTSPATPAVSQQPVASTYYQGQASQAAVSGGPTTSPGAPGASPPQSSVVQPSTGGSSSSDPVTTISGTLYYQDSAGDTLPMRDVYVEVWSNGIDCLTQPCVDGEVGHTSTNENGFFSLTFNLDCGTLGCSSPRIWPVAFSKGHGASPDVADVFCGALDCIIPQVGPGLEILRTYHWEFNPIPLDTSGGNIDWGTGTLTYSENPTKAQAFHVYDVILSEWLFIHDQTQAAGATWNVPYVGVYFPCEASDTTIAIPICPNVEWFDPYFTHEINIKLTSSDDTILHEYSHFVMFQAYSQSWPVTPPDQVGTFSSSYIDCSSYLSFLGPAAPIICAFTAGTGDILNTDCLFHRDPLVPSCAWSEGWADFVPSELGHPVNWCVNSAGTNSLDTPSLKIGAPAPGPGQADECQVASALWIATHPENGIAGAVGVPFGELISTMRGATQSCSSYGNPPVGEQCVSSQTDFRDFYNAFVARGYDPTWLNYGAFRNGLFKVTATNACVDGTAVTADSSGDLTFNLTDCGTGAVVGHVTLPAGTDVLSDTVSFSFTDNGTTASLGVSGVSVPYPPGKTLSIPSDGNNGVCIVDSSSAPTSPACDVTDTSISQVLIPCDGVTRTFTGFPDVPTSRTYDCQQSGGLDTVSGLAFSFVESVTHRTTSTTVHCSPGMDQVSVATTCTASVDDTSLGTVVTPAGQVSFNTDGSGSFASATCTLAEVFVGVASCSVAYTPSPGSEGVHNIGASYPGDSAHFLSAGYPFPLYVQTPTTTSIACPTPIDIGTSESCTVTVTNVDSGYAVAASGTVTFTGAPDGFPPSCLFSGGSCSFDWTPAVGSQGSYSILATYGGDTLHAGSSGSQSLTVMAPTTVTYQGATSGEYSDSVNLTAVLQDETGAPIAGETLTFTLGTQTATAVTGPNGAAQVTLTLDQPKGPYTVTASFAGDASEYYLPSSGSSPFTVNPEPASAAYTGTADVLTTTTSGYITLSAQVTSELNDAPGNIQYAEVTFYVYSTGSPSVLIYTSSPVAATQTSPGVGVASLTVPCSSFGDAGCLTEGTYLVYARLDPATNGYYTAPDAYNTLVVYTPNGQFTTLGGWVVDPGTGNHANLAGTVRITHSGALRGSFVYTYSGACPAGIVSTDGTCDFKIEATSWTGASVGFSSFGCAAGTACYASFQATGVIEVSDSVTGAVLASEGNTLITVGVWDNQGTANNGGVDQFTLSAVYPQPLGGVTSYQIGTVTGPVSLVGGNIVVH